MSTYPWSAFLEGERDEEYVNKPLTAADYQRFCLFVGGVDFRLELASLPKPVEKPKDYSKNSPNLL